MKEKINDKYSGILNYLINLKKIFGKDIKKLPFAILLTFILSLLEIFSIGLVFPIIALFTKPELIFDNKFFNFFFSDYNHSIDQGYLILFLSVSLMIIFFLKFFLNIIVNAYILNLIYNNNLSLKSNLLKIYQNLDYLQYLKKNSSNYINSLNNFATQIQYSIHAILIVMSEIIIATFIFLFLFFTTGIKFIIIGIFFVAIIYVFDKIFKNKVMKIGNMVNTNQDKIIQYINEAIFGYKDIKILHKENAFHKKFFDTAKEFKDLKFKLSFIQLIPRPLLELIIIISIMTIVLISKFYFNNLEYVLPTLSMYFVSLIRFFPACTKIINNMVYLRNGVDATLKIANDLDLYTQYQPRKFNYDGKVTNETEFNCLELKNVSFKYPENNNYLFQNLNLKIQKNSIVGISGPSGKGKTTLLNILLGFLNIENGMVLLNDKKIENYLYYPKNFFAYLPQDVFLIDDTILKNIALGEEKIDYKAFLKSIRKARIEEFINQLKDKEETFLGERGAKISGGQKQRIALARAFYFQSKIIVLDESTTSLDKITQKEILDEIKLLKKETTFIIISHDSEVLNICDQVINLSKFN